MGCRNSAFVAVTLLALAAGCVGQAQPNEVRPIEVVEWEPPEPQVSLFVLDHVLVATRFDDAWDAAAGEAALRELGFEPADDGNWTQAGANVTARVAHDEAGYWLNLTYAGFDVAAPTLEEAQARADAAWDEQEWRFVAALGAYADRAGHAPARTPERTDTFYALLG